ncbi:MULTISPECIES: PsiF family protein [Rhodopseudomonas]|uniref:Phosphate starvation-inducible protein PsiF n=1 Tax=Rhodopseudomonas palustris TaxID=1076 RepID=A0A0D7F4G2_RHOPL|nr:MULTISPECIES: PsiF family protein [Rhodopseudomonas]KIZ48004.1 phosphate starvation-inducible protein PsiF [Rhodopseudomonas palustris]MDF3812110.1 PsiF family protein [Rhodopseudomonas sp. BAL398]WOK16568.1 PsiF family protein [Rhodopseudomonas sp. BAL398]
MNMLSRCAVATAVTSLLLTGAAFAQTAAPAPKTAPSTMAPTAKKTAAPRTAASLDCSKQADAKGLHGKERKKFRKACIKTAKPI